MAIQAHLKLYAQRRSPVAHAKRLLCSAARPALPGSRRGRHSRVYRSGQSGEICCGRIRSSYAQTTIHRTMCLPVVLRKCIHLLLRAAAHLRAPVPSWKCGLRWRTQCSPIAAFVEGIALKTVCWAGDDADQRQPSTTAPMSSVCPASKKDLASSSLERWRQASRLWRRAQPPCQKLSVTACWCSLKTMMRLRTHQKLMGIRN